MKMTKWFPADIKPVHIGLYDTGDVLDYWDGTFWNVATDDEIDAGVFLHYPRFFQDQIWRGLARKPK